MVSTRFGGSATIARRAYTSSSAVRATTPCSSHSSEVTGEFSRTLPPSDAGFLNRADMLSNGNWVGLNLVTPTSWYRQLYLNFNQWNDYTTDGLVLNHGGNFNFSGQLQNQWWFGGGYNINRLGETYDDRMARGGPAVRRDARSTT